MRRARRGRDHGGTAAARGCPGPHRRCGEAPRRHRLVVADSTRAIAPRHARLLATKRSHLIGVWFAAPVCSTLKAIMALRSIDESFLARALRNRSALPGGW